MRNPIGRMFLAASTVLGLLCVPAIGRATEPVADPTVVISEVGWAGSSASTVDEWLELTNLTDKTVPIGGWTVAGAATSGADIVLPDESAIEPYSTFLIANYDADNAKSTLDAVPNFVTSSLSLSNASLSLELVDESGTVRDTAGDESKPFAGTVGGNAGQFAAMVRRDPIGAGTEADSWATATESLGFDPGAKELGTPGSIETWFAHEDAEETVDAAAPETSFFDEQPANDVENPITEPDSAVPDATDIDQEPDTENPVDPLVESDEPIPAEDSTDNPSSDSPDETQSEAAGTTVDNAAETEVAIPVITKSEEKETEAISDSEAETPAEPAKYPVGTLLINEFVSDTDMEWIEITNPFNNVIPLTGWTVRDASGKPTDLPNEPLGMGRFVVLKNPKGRLNNDGDTIELVDPAGTVIDSVRYGTDELAAPKKNSSLARDENGSWRATDTTTPGAANAIPQPATNEPDGTDGSSVADQSDSDAKQTTAEEATNSTATAMEETEITPAASAAWTGPKTLRFSELYANTSGSDVAEEFIEIENTGVEPIDLFGWSVCDASSDCYVPDASLLVPPGAHMALIRPVTHISLNNDKETVTLSAPDGAIVDTCAYENAPNSSSLVLVDSEWVWTGTPTPNEPNKISRDEAGSKVAGPVASKAPAVAASTARRVSAADPRIEVTGTVLVIPGVLGRQIFYVATDDGGLQIYDYDGDFPDLTEGDRVIVAGIRTTVRGEPRLKMGSGDDVTIIGQDPVPEPEDAEIGSLTESDHGRLVRVTGTVLKRSGNRVTIENAGAQLSLRVADGTDIDPAWFVRGKQVTVTGILVYSGSSPSLLPRGQDDLEEIQTAPETTGTVAEPTGNEIKQTRDQKTAEAISFGTVAILAAYSGRKFIPKAMLWYAKTRAVRAALKAAN